MREGKCEATRQTWTLCFFIFEHTLVGMHKPIDNQCYNDYSPHLLNGSAIFHTYRNDQKW